MFQTVPLSSSVFHCIHGNGMCHTACDQQDWDGTAVPSQSCPQAVSKTCMAHNIAVCTAKNWWWTEELSETCKVLFQK